MLTHRRCLLAAGLLGLLLAAPARAAVTDEQVSAAIDRGVAYLLSSQTDQGWWSPNANFSWGFNFTGGYECLAMLALAYAETPRSEPKMQKGFDELLAMKFQHTYNCALRTMILSKLLPKIDRQMAPAVRKVMLADVDFLIKTQLASGGWDYPRYDYLSGGVPAKRDDDLWDFSNVQIAVLGLSEAIHAGVELPRETMERLQKLYLDWQHPSGGWGYGRPAQGGVPGKQEPYGSMTAAAVASLFITRDFLYRGVGCPCSGGKSKGAVPQVDQAIDQGLAWLGQNFTAGANPKSEKWILYWLYSCERVGLASGIKYFGGHDWYAEGAEYVLRQQKANGSWGAAFDTTFALCFLVKGRAPILFNKLELKSQWNNHPRDLANLVGVIGQKKEQLLQWQIITLQAPVTEWHDAPVLYITAESALELTAEEKQKLRSYTDTGGTIFFEASCGNPAAKRSWEMLCKELWPEFELKVLDKDHPLWTAERKITGRLPSLFGMNDGVRTFLLVSWSDVSCAWHTLAVTRQEPLFDLGNNLPVYASDRRPLRSRLASRRVVEKKSYLDTKVTVGAKANLTVARVKHGGDWYTGQNYQLMERLAADLAERTALKLRSVAAVAPSALAVAGVQVAWLTGRQSVLLDEAEVAALKAYLASGGFLLVEATLGDERFDAAFRPLAGNLGLTMKAVAKDDPLVTGKLEGTSGYDVSGVKYKFALRPARIGKPQPELFGLYLGEKRVGVYSPYDLMYCQTGMDAYDCRGYEAEDARAVLTNVMVTAGGRL